MSLFRCDDEITSESTLLLLGRSIGYPFCSSIGVEVALLLLGRSIGDRFCSSIGVEVALLLLADFLICQTLSTLCLGATYALRSWMPAAGAILSSLGMPALKCTYLHSRVWDSSSKGKSQQRDLHKQFESDHGEWMQD